MSDDKAKVACLSDALEHGATLDEPAWIFICQGPPRCERKCDEPPFDCPWCAKIRSDDPRDPDDIIAEMKQSQ